MNILKWVKGIFAPLESILEIERKFLIKEFPSLPVVKMKFIKQGYLSISPEVRIREEELLYNAKAIKKHISKFSYILTIKGDGTLERPEINLKLNKREYDELKKLVVGKMSEKFCSEYDMVGYILVCNKVDHLTKHGFWYAEVEFETKEKAMNFTPLNFLGEEITENPFYKMKNHWCRLNEM